MIVDEAHTRNRAAETHSTSIEGLRVSIAAGIDGIQHPELLDGREMPDDLVKTIVDRGLNCSMLASTITGPAWKRHLKSKEEAEKKKAEGKAEAEKDGRRRRARRRPRSGARRRPTPAPISRCGARTRRS